LPLFFWTCWGDGRAQNSCHGPKDGINLVHPRLGYPNLSQLHHGYLDDLFVKIMEDISKHHGYPNIMDDMFVKTIGKPKGLMTLHLVDARDGHACVCLSFPTMGTPMAQPAHTWVPVIPQNCRLFVGEKSWDTNNSSMNLGVYHDN